MANKESEEKKDDKTRGKINQGLSLIDPELENLGARIAAMIPEESPLRTTVVRRIFGFVKSWIETKAENMHPIVGAIVEKLSDLGDFIIGGVASDKGSKSVKGWMDSFQKESFERIKKSKDPKGELERIREEFDARKDIIRIIEEERRASDPEAKTVQPGLWEEWRNSFLQIDEFVNSRLEPIAKELEDFREERTNQIYRTKPSIFKRIGAWWKNLGTSRAEENELTATATPVQSESGKPSSYELNFSLLRFSIKKLWK